MQCLGEMFIYGGKQMAVLKTLTLTEKSIDIKAWNKIITSTFNYDFYHLAGYHLIAHKNGEGIPALLAFEESDYLIALPLLFKPVAQVDGLESSDYLDASSVYGYAGPVFSRPDIPKPVIREFQKLVKQYLNEQKVIAVFSRLHPLYVQHQVIDGLGSIVPSGQTVSINLTIPPDQQLKQYIKGHRYSINKLKRSGWKCISCCGSACKEKLLDEFVAIYWETMKRVAANEYYYFSREYFERLFQLSDVEIWIFAATKDNKIGAAGIFSLCNGIVQYYLSGTKPEFFKESPIKLILDEVRLWAIRRGARIFHLGGGVGGKQDLLFSFKAGFSEYHHQFNLWKWVVDQEKYNEICAKKREWNKAHQLSPIDEGFFPKYRTPVISIKNY